MEVGVGEREARVGRSSGIMMKMRKTTTQSARRVNDNIDNNLTP